jgi:hypothetical protein
MGAKRSSASERGAMITRQRMTSAKIAFFNVLSGPRLMSARVVRFLRFNIFRRVLPEQIESLSQVPW